MFIKYLNHINSLNYRFRLNIFFYILRLFKINVVYNGKARSKFNSSKFKNFFNVILVTESPNYAKLHGWFKYDYEYDLEISFRSKSQSKNHIALKDSYCVVDKFGELKNNPILLDDKIDHYVLLISKRKELRGHKLRHQILRRYSELNINIDFYGSAINKPYSDSVSIYEKYTYLIIIENAIYGNYISEKFFDGIKSKSIIFYYGDINLLNELGFNLTPIISFNSFNDLKTKIHSNTLRKINCPEMQKHIDFNFKQLQILRSRKINQFFSSLSCITHLLNNDGKYDKRNFSKLFK